MTEDKLKQIITAGLGFGALAIPHFQDVVTAVGGDHTVMQAGLGAWALFVLVRGIVDYVHGAASGGGGGKAAGIALLVFLTPAVGAAQDAPAEPNRGGVLFTYAVDHHEPDIGRAGLEVDLRVGGTPLLLVGHLKDGEGGIGPKVQHNLGPIVLYGHTVFGTFKAGPEAMSESQLRHGGGVEVPVRDGVFVRIGVEHTPNGDDDVTATSVGIGWRW